MHSFIRKTLLFPFILVQETAVKLLIDTSQHSVQNYFILQAFQASTKKKLKLCTTLHRNLTENAETYYMQLSLILQCFQDIFIIYQFQIMLWNGPECLKNGLKKHMFRVRQNARLNSLKIHTNYCTLCNDTSCRVETAYRNDYYLNPKGKSSTESKDLSAACESFNSGNEINRKLKKLKVFTFKRTRFRTFRTQIPTRYTR